MKKSVNKFDYKNIELLKKYLNENKTIMSSSMKNTSAKEQRSLSIAIKRARFLSLLPYCDRHGDLE